mmetsp:Transcript_16399/g.38867  ORF Transcript_16399/g.38867 Transcript_16399/m.38867 type:complete len:390 (+) Transcript_16399:33-1202(+)
MAMSLFFLALLPTAMGGGSLYCFTCVTPNTYEVGMIAAMEKLGVGMFECDGFDIISNTTADELFKDYPETAKKLADKVHVIQRELYVKTVKGPVGHDTSSPATDPTSPLYQGKHAVMKHLANTPVFKDVWSKLFELGTFEKYDYTCKLDVDAVIVPARLSGMLATRPAKKEFFLNSLHDMYGNFLHGPVELISKLGMYAFRDAFDACDKKLDEQLYGEDFWANKCWALLAIPAVKTADMRLLYDEYEWGKSAQHHCSGLNPDPAVYEGKQYFGVYHPRKNMKDWLACRVQTGVPKQISEEDVQQAVKMAGPGKPDKILGKMYEMPPGQTWSLSLSKSACLGFALLAVLATAAAVTFNRKSQRAVVLDSDVGEPPCRHLREESDELEVLV